MTFQTPSRLLSDTIQTLSRASKHIPGTFCYISISLKDPVPKSQVTRRVGGWVVVYRYIIMPLRCPTCKMVLARIQFPLNSKLDPSVAKCRRDLRVYLLNRVYPYLIGWRSFQGCLIGSGYCNQHNVRVTREVNPKRMSSRDKNGEV